MIHKIKALHDDGQGLSIRAIGQELGISRNTVRKYLRQDEATIEAAQSNREREKKLDAHRDTIVYLLRTFPKLSSVKVARKLREKVGELAVADTTGLVEVASVGGLLEDLLAEMLGEGRGEPLLEEPDIAALPQVTGIGSFASCHDVLTSLLRAHIRL